MIFSEYENPCKALVHEYARNSIKDININIETGWSFFKHYAAWFTQHRRNNTWISICISVKYEYWKCKLSALPSKWDESISRIYCSKLWPASQRGQ